MLIAYIYDIGKFPIVRFVRDGENLAEFFGQIFCEENILRTISLTAKNTKISFDEFKIVKCEKLANPLTRWTIHKNAKEWGVIRFVPKY